MRTLSTPSPAPAKGFLNPLTSLVGVLLVLLLAGGCGGTRGSAEQAAADGAAEPVAPFPAFELASLAGGTVRLADYQGQVLLMDFWATWCKPCHKQAEILRPLYEEYRGQGVEFLAVDSGEDVNTVLRFVAENPFPYPVALDPQDELGFELGFVGLPALVVVDGEGRMTYEHVGIVDARTLQRELEKALEG